MADEAPIRGVAGRRPARLCWGLYGGAAVITAEPVEAIRPDPPGKYKLAKTYEPIDHDALLDERYAPKAR